MCTWNYAYWAARKGNWLQAACDRDRFQRRVTEIENKISHVLSQEHRQKIFVKLK